MQEETNKLEEVLITCYLDALEQLNDHKGGGLRLLLELVKPC